jgi:AcrR family transcriptional regulator
MRLRQHNPDAQTRDALKLTARRLFATRGIDGVSVREIVIQAGQRNGGSLHYHFGTKEALVRELVVDGAKLIDDRRTVLLDAIQKRDSPPSLREIIEILVWPSTNLRHEGSGEDTYIRFINVLQMSHRQLFLDALENRWNAGYQRCLAHIRELLPKVPSLILNQRLIFMGIYLPAILSSRETALDEQHGRHHFWSAPYTMENVIDSIESLLRGPVSAQTHSKIPPSVAGNPIAKRSGGSGRERDRRP